MMNIFHGCLSRTSVRSESQSISVCSQNYLQLPNLCEIHAIVFYLIFLLSLNDSFPNVKQTPHFTERGYMFLFEQYCFSLTRLDWPEILTALKMADCAPKCFP